MSNDSLDYDAAKNFHEKLDSHFTWSPCEGKCPSCHESALESAALTSFRPLSGGIRCTSCKHHWSMTSFIAHSIINIAPLPPGALASYDRDIEIDKIICNDYVGKKDKGD